MAWHRPGAKQLSEPMMVRLLMIYASLGINESMETLSGYMKILHFELVVSAYSMKLLQYVKHSKQIWIFE